jgi:hypothetical protein
MGRLHDMGPQPEGRILVAALQLGVVRQREGRREQCPNQKNSRPLMR